MEREGKMNASSTPKSVKDTVMSFMFCRSIVHPALALTPNWTVKLKEESYLTHLAY